MASLWVISGSRAGESVGVTDELIIGRENADLTIDDAEVSRRHAAVRLQGGQLEVEDLGSSNGTFVDGSRIEGPVRVGGGAKIRVGQTEFEVRGVAPTSGEKQDSTQAAASPTADSDLTRARPTLDPELTKARSVLDPEVTKARAIPEPEVTKARAIPEPEVTKARAIPEPEVTKARAIPDVQKTKAHAAPDPQVTQARSAPAPAAPAARASKDVAPQVAPFSPPARRRGRRLASRRWVPTVASFGTAVAAAVGLIVYFAIHGVPS
jgi:ABC transport system ATP-binding/permease protein